MPKGNFYVTLRVNSRTVFRFGTRDETFPRRIIYKFACHATDFFSKIHNFVAKNTLFCNF